MADYWVALAARQLRIENESTALSMPEKNDCGGKGERGERRDREGGGDEKSTNCISSPKGIESSLDSRVGWGDGVGDVVNGMHVK